MTLRTVAALLLAAAALAFAFAWLTRPSDPVEHVDLTHAIRAVERTLVPTPAPPSTPAPPAPATPAPPSVVSEPAPAPTTRPGSGATGGGVQQRICDAWPGDCAKALRVVDCESNFNPRAVNPRGFYGLWQFNLQTWRSVGGTGNPRDASIEEQTQRAWTLYQRRGWQPWPVCGKR